MEKLFAKISEYIFLLFIILLPISNRELPVTGMIIKSDIILMLFFLIFILRVILFRNHRKEFMVFSKKACTTLFFICLCTLTIIMFYSISYSEFKMVSTKESLRFLTYIIMMLLVAFDFGKQEWIKKISDGLILTTLIQCILGITQFFTGFMILSEFSSAAYKWNRIHGTFENPNTFAGFLVVMFFPILMIGFKKNAKEINYKYIGMILLIMINLMLSLSRNGLIGIFVGFILLAVIYNKKVLYILIGPGTIMGLFVLKSRNIFNIIFSDTRIPLWKCAMQMIKDNPIKGIGNGCYREAYNIYRVNYPEFRVHSFLNMPPHNSFLKFWSELGFIAVGLFMVVIISSFNMIKKIIDKDENEFIKRFFFGVICSFAAFIVMNSMDDLFFVPKLTSFFWILTALAWGIEQRRSY